MCRCKLSAAQGRLKTVRGHACRIEELDIGYIDGMLLLPLIQEHTIDERSPLCGHTHDSLMAVSICPWSNVHMSSPKTDEAELGNTAGELQREQPHDWHS